MYVFMGILCRMWEICLRESMLVLYLSNIPYKMLMVYTQQSA